MSITIATLKAAGLTADQIVAVLEKAEIEQAAADEARRIKNRDRMRASRALHSANDDAQRAHDAQPPQVSPSSSSPTPPITPSPSSPSSSLRSDSIKASDWPQDFREKFWSAYPRKVGKKAAIRKLELVRRNGEISWSALLAAVARIETKDPQFIPHPTTWLNEGRYLDLLSTGPPAGAGGYQPPPGAISYVERVKARANGTATGTEIRGDAGLGEDGSDHAQKLRLSG